MSVVGTEELLAGARLRIRGIGEPAINRQAEVIVSIEGQPTHIFVTPTTNLAKLLLRAGMPVDEVRIYVDHIDLMKAPEPSREASIILSPKQAKKAGFISD